MIKIKIGLIRKFNMIVEPIETAASTKFTIRNSASTVYGSTSISDSNHRIVCHFTHSAAPARFIKVSEQDIGSHIDITAGEICFRNAVICKFMAHRTGWGPAP